MTKDVQLSNAYDRAASRWRSKIETLGYAAAYRWVFHETGLRSTGASVLDVGCGTGDVSRALVEVGGVPSSLTLLDPSAEMVSAARTSLEHIAMDLNGHVATLDDADIPRHDIVLCAHVIEHLPDPTQALRQLRDKLRPGGRLLIVVSKPHWCNWIIWVRWRHRMYAPRQMLRLIAESGLTPLWHAGFPAGPPSRSSHAYLLSDQTETLDDTR